MNLGLRRQFKWRFIVADVTKPILGADFLQYYGLLVDIKNNKLLDSTTRLAVTAHSSNDNTSTIYYVLGRNSRYHRLLQVFTDLQVIAYSQRDQALRCPPNRNQRTAHSRKDAQIVPRNVQSRPGRVPVHGRTRNFPPISQSLEQPFTYGPEENERNMETLWRLSPSQRCYDTGSLPYSDLSNGRPV